MHTLLHRYILPQSWGNKKILRELWYGYHVKSSSFCFLNSFFLLSISTKPLFSLLSNLSILFSLIRSLRLSANRCHDIWWEGGRETQAQRAYFCHVERDLDGLHRASPPGDHWKQFPVSRGASFRSSPLKIKLKAVVGFSEEPDFLTQNSSVIADNSNNTEVLPKYVILFLWKMHLQFWFGIWGIHPIFFLFFLLNEAVVLTGSRRERGFWGAIGVLGCMISFTYSLFSQRI